MQTWETMSKCFVGLLSIRKITRHDDESIIFHDRIIFHVSPFIIIITSTFLHIHSVQCAFKSLKTEKIEVLSVAGQNIWYRISLAFVFIDHRDAIKMDKLDKLRSFIFHIWSFERRTPTIYYLSTNNSFFSWISTIHIHIHLCVAIIICMATALEINECKYAQFIKNCPIKFLCFVTHISLSHLVNIFFFNFDLPCWKVKRFPFDRVAHNQCSNQFFVSIHFSSSCLTLSGVCRVHYYYKSEVDRYPNRIFGMGILFGMFVWSFRRYFTL